MTEEPENPEEEATPAVTAVVGDTITTIKATNPTALKASLFYSALDDAENVRFGGTQVGTKTYNPDGTFFYQFSWEADNVQNQDDTDYVGQVKLNDGTSIPVTWTQPGLNSSPDDGVMLDNRNLPRLAALSFIASKASVQGWLLPNDWYNFRAGVFSLAWFNSIIWEDGR